MMAGIPAAADNASSDFLKSIEFHMYAFKILSCPLKTSHSWSDCPWAHPKEQARRRDPRRWYYTPVMCPYAKQGAFACPRGDSCDMAHQVYELWLHPAKFRTELCRKGPLCDRRLCFFAHRPDEVRSPTEEGLIASGAMAPRPTTAQAHSTTQPYGATASSAAAMMALLGPLDGGGGGGGGDALALNAAAALHPTAFATATAHTHVGGLVAPHGVGVPGGWADDETAAAAAAAAAGGGHALLATPGGGFATTAGALGINPGSGSLYAIPSSGALSHQHHHPHRQLQAAPQSPSPLIMLQSMGFDAAGPVPFAQQLHHQLQRGASLDTAGSAASSGALHQLPASTVVAAAAYSPVHHSATADHQLQQHLAQLRHHQAAAQAQLLQLGAAPSPVSAPHAWGGPAHLLAPDQGPRSSPPPASELGSGTVIAPRSPPTTTAAVQPRPVLVIGALPGSDASSAAGDLDALYGPADAAALRRSVAAAGSAPLPPVPQTAHVAAAAAPTTGAFEPASISAPLSVLSRGGSGASGGDDTDGAAAGASAACGALQLRALALRLQELTDAAAAAEAEAGDGAAGPGGAAGSAGGEPSGRLRMVRALASALKEELSGLAGPAPGPAPSDINSDEVLTVP